LTPEQQAAAKKAASTKRQEAFDMIEKPLTGDFWTLHSYPWQKAK
jgi:hypothetical protein